MSARPQHDQTGATDDVVIVEGGWRRNEYFYGAVLQKDVRINISGVIVALPGAMRNMIRESSPARVWAAFAVYDGV